MNKQRRVSAGSIASLELTAGNQTEKIRMLGWRKRGSTSQNAPGQPGPRRQVRRNPMTASEIYRQAIKRTFADLYGVSPDTVDVTWTSDGESIIARCAGKTFIHLILSGPDDNAPQFLSPDEDPIVVTLTNDERQKLEGAV